MKLIILTALLATLSAGCSQHKPPNLTPDASMAYDSGRIVNALDDVRDVAIIASSFNQVPFSTAVTRRIVTGHQSALVIIETRGAGWEAQVQAVLGEVLKNTTGEAHTRLEPYVELARALLTRLGTRAFDEPLSADILAAYRELLARSAAVDTAWLASH